MLKIQIENWFLEHDEYEDLDELLTEDINNKINIEQTYINIRFREKDEPELKQITVNYFIENNEITILNDEIIQGIEQSDVIYFILDAYEMSNVGKKLKKNNPI